MQQSEHKEAAARRGDTLACAKRFDLSPSFLEKDRIGAKRIPYIKIGRKVLYDFESVERALLAYQVGGPPPAASARGRR